MKIVLDTNVLISGIFWKGTPYKILEFWALKKFDILATELILNEYYRVIEKIDDGGGISESWTVFIAQNSIVVKDSNIVKLCRDPKDDIFLNCAISGKAKYLISGDDDLLSLKKIKATEIITPARFLKMIKERC